MSDKRHDFYTGDVCREDLIEISRRPTNYRLKTFAQWAFFTCICFALAVLLIRGSQPELTPLQIVQLDGYQGAQQVRTIFNLKSRTREPGLTGRLEPAIEIAESENELNRTPVVAAAGRGLGGSIEVPASAFNRVELPAPTQVGQIMPWPVAPLKMTEDERVESRLLPVFSVIVDRVELREAPSSASRVVMSVARMETVTLFSTQGEWVEVAANDGSGQTGFVPKSAIVALEP